MGKILLADFLTAEKVRQINLDIFHEPDEAYLRLGPQHNLTARDTEQKIRNVKDSDINQIIRAVKAFDAERFADGWAHFVCLGAGRHLWPDANHRTALTAFADAFFEAEGKLVILPPEYAESLRMESKRVRDSDFLTRTRASYYTVAELADPTHRYRKIYEDLKGKLVLRKPP